MATTFSEAIMARILNETSSDPTEKEAVQSYLADRADARLESKANRIENIAAKLSIAKEANQPPAVINAYEKLLSQLTSF